MDFKNEHLQKVQQFVPESYQGTAENFMYYLKTLSFKRYEIRFYSLALNETGIQIIDYFKHYTPVEEISWRLLKSMVDAEYKQSVIHSVQYGLMLDQLKGAF